jgi:hypothetical protein
LTEVQRLRGVAARGFIAGTRAVKPKGGFKVGLSNGKSKQAKRHGASVVVM